MNKKKKNKKYKNVVDFKELISVRFTEEQTKKIRGLVLLNSDKYKNESHFIRCAVIKLINSHINNKK